MSVFPNELDTDLEIPRVDDNVTEVSGDSINAIRDAIFAIEKTIGVSPQGNKVSLDERISVSLDSNGEIKTSALAGKGLITLPITNSQVGATAGILESKLNLDFSTQSLKNTTNSLTLDVATLQSSFNTLIIAFNNHTSGLSNLHDGYQININTGTSIGVAGLSATTIGDAVNEYSTILITGDGSRPGHIDLSLANNIKHTADFVSVDSSSFTVIDSTSVTVQDALDSIDNSRQMIEHVDNLHSNGILKEINSGEFYNPNQRKVGPVVVAYIVGTTVAQITGVTSFSDLKIVKGDILEIQTGVDDAGTYRIQAMGPRTGTGTLGGLPELAVDEVDVFHVFTSTEAAATGSIYKAASVSSESAPLACSVRNSNTLVDTVTILNPDAARVVSIGFNGTILNADGYEINVEVGLGNGNVRGLTIPDLYFERLGSAPPSVVDAQSVAERINAYVSHPTTGFHFPISAFRVGNELAIAHNMVGEDFTLKVLDGYTGNRALGLDANGADILDLEIAGNDNNLFNVNGKSLSTLRTLVDGYATITSSTDTFAIFNDNGSSVNPTNLGIRSGSVLHITGHPTLDVNGSYTLSSASSSDVTVFAAETIPVVGGSTTFDVLITDSHVSLNQLFSAETDLGLVEIFVDEDGKVLVNQRLTHEDSIGPEISIIGVSDGFPPSTVILRQDVIAGSDLMTFAIIASSVPGNTVTVDKDFLGTFKVYHSDNINYITVRVNSEISGVDDINVTVDDSLNLDETMKLCILHFDSSNSITSVLDTRNFGNMGSNQIRDDFVELFSQRPISDLRSDGVVRGFDVMDLPYVDTLTSMQALPLNGGVAYINGVRVVVETQKVILQSYDSDGNLNSNITRIIGINDFGTMRAFDDELSEILSDGYNSSVQFGKILPLYRVTLDSDGLIDEITDLRLFINNLDEKIELIVDESNNVVGSFRSLAGALLYAGSYPGGERLTVKIINIVTPDRALVVPNGVSIIGGAAYGGGRHKIVNTLDLNNHVLTLSGDNRLENIEIDSETIGMDGYLVAVNGSNVNIEKCTLGFSDPVSLGSFTNGSDHAVGFLNGASSNVRVVNNRINKVFAGIVSTVGCSNLVITDNVLTNIVGFGIETHGILVGSSRAVSNIDISRNTIEVPSIAFSDIMGIKVAITNTIDEVRLVGNTIKQENGDTMTSGIRVENVTAGSNKVTDLFIKDNLIRGIGLNGNYVFGIYVNDAERAIVTDNILRDIGTGANTETAFIRIDADVSSSVVHNNILEDGDCLSGIDVGTSSNVSVIGNTINNVGDTSGGTVAGSTVFVRGNSPGAMISNNTLIAASTETSPYGIYWAGAGSQTQISNNILKSNSAGLDSFTDHGVRFLGTDMDITGNTITGMADVSNGISSGDGANRSKIVGNTIQGDITVSINIGTVVTDCFVAGNMLQSTDASVTGSTSLIGINRGLLDIIGVSIASGVPLADTVVGWDFDSGNLRWNYLTAGFIHFPLNGMPNGSRIVSVQVNGVGSTGDYTITVYRKAIASPYSIAALGGSSSISPTAAFEEVLATGSEVIDHSIYTYTLSISVTGGSAGNDRIHGVFINIRY